MVIEDDDRDLGPDERDYDLSEEHGYTWEPRRRDWPVPLPVLAVISVLVIIALVVPALIIVLQND